MHIKIKKALTLLPYHLLRLIVIAPATLISFTNSAAGEFASGSNVNTKYLFYEDFELESYQNKWNVKWGKAAGAGLISLNDSPVFMGKYSAYLQAKAGEHHSIGTGEHILDATFPDVAFVRLYLRFDDDFDLDTANQLKLFGIQGGATLRDTYGGAGKKATGRNKFSTILSIDNWNEIHLYTYHADQRGGYGEWFYCDGWFCGPKLIPGKWHCLELMLKTNTPNQKDGALQAWLDNELIIKKEGLRFRDTTDVTIRRFTIPGYFGGGGQRNTSPKDQRIYIDNYVINDSRIGCIN